MNADVLAEMIRDDAPAGVFRDAFMDAFGEHAVIECYAVMGQNGILSAPSWFVGVFLDKNAADAMAFRCNGWLRDNKLHVSNVGPYIHASDAIACGSIPSGMNRSRYRLPALPILSGTFPVANSGTFPETPFIVCGSLPFFGTRTPLKNPHDSRYVYDDRNGTNYSVIPVPMRA